MVFGLGCEASGFCVKQNHIEGYLELSAKTKIYFSTAVALWDAEFYVKVEDDCLLRKYVR